jgi:hypothetical protein
MDPTKLLEADHREVESLFDQIESTEGPARQPFIDQLATALQAHMELEESVVYPGIEPAVGSEAVQEGVTEHKLARNDLAAMLALAPDEPGFGAALEAVKAGIGHHVEEEESEVFPQARKDGPELLAEMEHTFLRKRQELGLPIDGPTIAASSTRDELVAAARELDLRGASSMTKGELADALAEHLV